MPNSDNTYGTFNKQTVTFRQPGPEFITFANVAAAQSHFFTADALAVWDETCTNIQWALTNARTGDNTSLKVTFDFGTKGGQIDPADDWAGQYNSRKAALIAAENWANNTYLEEAATDAVDHLF